MKDRDDIKSQIVPTEQSMISKIVTYFFTLLKKLLLPKVEQWRSIMMAVFLAIMIKQFFFCLTTIMSSSMAPTMPTGTKVIISRPNLGYHTSHISGRFRDINWEILHREPYRGQIISFFVTKTSGVTRHKETMWMKRIIAIAGDQVVIDGKSVYINGNELTRTKVPNNQLTDDMKLMIKERPTIEIFEEELSGRKYFIALDAAIKSNIRREFVIPENHVFLMGDNRDNSEDSRVIGAMPIYNIVGSAYVIAVSASFVIAIKNFFKSFFTFNYHVIQKSSQSLWNLLCGPDKRPINKLFWRQLN